MHKSFTAALFIILQTHKKVNPFHKGLLNKLWYNHAFNDVVIKKCFRKKIMLLIQNNQIHNQVSTCDCVFLPPLSFLSLLLSFSHTHTHTLYWGIYQSKYFWKTPQIITWVVNFTDAISSDFQLFSHSVGILLPKWAYSILMLTIRSIVLLI